MSPPEIMSCMTCRSRKLKCDRNKPKCGRCLGTKRECAYPERKRIAADGKRRDIKALEARLSVAESKLALRVASGTTFRTIDRAQDVRQSDHDNASLETSGSYAIDDYGRRLFPENVVTRTSLEYIPHENGYFRSQDLDGLGLQEPLPPGEIQQELFQIYFDQIHVCIPIIHKLKFYAALKLGINLRPPLSLQYAMWSIAASVSQKYGKLCEILIQRARKYAERVEMKGNGEPHTTVYDAQCWHLIATFEAQRMYVTRAWISTGRCVSLVQMMGLHCIDQPGFNATRILPPTEDFIELEERRRTFWAAYLGDRWASALGGWPMTIKESGIFTNLPTSEASFERGHEEARISLAEAMTEGGASKLSSSFSGVILATTLMAHNYAHIQQSTKFKHTQNGNDEAFWSRHREMDNSLSTTFMYLPERFKVAQGLRDPNAVFLSMALQAAIICLHQTAIRKSLSCQFESNVAGQSMARCITAAHAITSTVRLVSHEDLSRINPWTGFCLYVAGLVYCHDLGGSHLPNRNEVSNVTFLLAIMKVIGRFHPITEYFTAQLELEMDAAQGRWSCTRPSVHLESFDRRHEPNDFSLRVQKRGAKTQFWRSLSVEERAMLSQKFLSSKPLAGILVLNSAGCPIQDGPGASDGPATTTCDSSSGDIPEGQKPVPQSQNSFDTEHSMRSRRFTTFPTQDNRSSNEEHIASGVLQELTAEVDRNQDLGSDPKWHLNLDTSSTRQAQVHAQEQVPSKELFYVQARTPQIEENNAYAGSNSQQPNPLSIQNLKLSYINSVPPLHSIQEKNFGVFSYNY